MTRRLPEKRLPDTGRRSPRRPLPLLAGHLFSLLLASTTSLPSVAAPFGWRGDGTNRYPDATPPLEWAPDRNVRWAAPLPASGNASPVVAGGLVFVTAEPATLLAFDANTGTLAWRRDVAVADALVEPEASRVRTALAEADAIAAQLASGRLELDRLRRDARKRGASAAIRTRIDTLQHDLDALKSRLEATAQWRPPIDLPVLGTASSTPVADDSGVFVAFGNGVVARFDHRGGRTWSRWFGVPDEPMRGYFRGQSASLLLVGGTLVVPFRKLRGLDPATGKDRWTSLDYRDFGTPAVAVAGGQPLLVTPSGEVVRPDDGRVLARGLGSVVYIGPVTSGADVYFVGSASDAELDTNQHAQAAALRLDAKPDASSAVVERRWSGELARERYYATPLVLGDRLLLLNRYDLFTVIDAASGKTVEERALPFSPGQVYSSLVAAGAHLFASKETGETIVLEATPPYRQVARNTLEELRSTPVFVGPRAYVRGFSKLWCLEATPKK